MKTQHNFDFIAKAKAIHASIYDYSKVDYQNARKKVVITCNIHGDFLQAPRHHLSGCGCPKCSRVNADNIRCLNTTKFVRKAEEVHGKKYDYGSTVYFKSSELISIKCKKHGEFLQRASHHLSGRGCPTCGSEKIKEYNTSNTREFIDKAISIYGELYDYSSVVYENAHSNITMICKVHGEFIQTPSNHLQGHGCAKCAKSVTKSSWTYTGWEQLGKNSKYFKGFTLYVLKLTSNDGEEFIKIGKTFTSLSRRFKSLPYEYEVIYTYTSTAKNVCELEAKLHRENRIHNYTPTKTFGGCKECYSKINVLGFWHGSMVKNGLITGSK